MEDTLERACSEKEASRPLLARRIRACRQERGLLMGEITPTDKVGLGYIRQPLAGTIPSVFDYHLAFHFTLAQSLLV